MLIPLSFTINMPRTEINRDLREAQLFFEDQIPLIEDGRRQFHDLRQAFVNYYTLRRIRTMPLDTYAIGNNLPDDGYNFCYTIERELDKLGRTIGANAFKFGVYFGRTKSDSEYKYRHTKKFGNTYREAFANVKNAIVKLIVDGNDENLDEIIKSPISPMFKGKILSTYYPERYLNVFSDYHLEYFLTQLNIDTKELIWSDPVLKREALVDYKNQDSVMKSWSVDIFSHFLYTVYPGRPPRENVEVPTDPLKDFKPPVFPINPTPVFIYYEIATDENTRSVNKSVKQESENPDYEGKRKRDKQLGDRGEHLVLQMEKERLKLFPKLAKRVKKAKFDYMGYDILSFDENGLERYIEVKATKSKSGQANFFLSYNELQKATELKNYWVYMVYDILSTSPKVWRIPNPFHPENALVKKTPISYRVMINTKSQ